MKRGADLLSYYLSTIESEKEKDLFTDLYKKYQRYMYYIAYNILYDSSASENIVHDAFIRIIENINKFDLSDERKTKGLLGIIVSGLAKNEYRRRNKIELFDEFPETLEYVSVTLEEQIIGQDQYNHLIKQIKELDDIYLDVLLLKVVYGMPNAEVSSFLGITEETVRQRYRRGKGKLKQSIAREGFEV